MNVAPGAKALTFVIRMNVAGRHLTPSRKAMRVAKLTAATTGSQRGGRPKTLAVASVFVATAAEAAGVTTVGE